MGNRSMLTAQLNALRNAPLSAKGIMMDDREYLAMSPQTMSRKVKQMNERDGVQEPGPRPRRKNSHSGLALRTAEALRRLDATESDD